MKIKPKLLWLSDSVLGVTGFGNQAKNVLNRLSALGQFECHAVGHNYLGQDLMPPIKFEDGETLNFQVHPGSFQAYALDRWQHYFEKYTPDIFTILLDTFMLYPHMLNINIPTRSVFYFPSDGEFFPENCDHILRKVNYPVAMSKFGQQQVKDLFKIEADYIPHGIDCYKQFYPLPEDYRLNLRKAWKIPEDAFIVGGVFRNQGRKNAPAMIKIFSKFAKDRDKC